MNEKTCQFCKFANHLPGLPAPLLICDHSPTPAKSKSLKISRNHLFIIPGPRKKSILNLTRANTPQPHPCRLNSVFCILPKILPRAVNNLRKSAKSADKKPSPSVLSGLSVARKSVKICEIRGFGLWRGNFFFKNSKKNAEKGLTGVQRGVY